MVTPGLALAGAAGVVSLAFALILFAARRESDAGRALALVLLVEGALHVGAALPPLAADAGLVAAARAADRLFLTALVAGAPAYLLLLREIPSPLADPLRARSAARALRLMPPAFALAGFALALVYPAVAFLIGALSFLAVSLYALAVAIDAHRRTAPGTPMRARASGFLLAFSIRDLARVLAILLSVAAVLPGAALVVVAAGTLAYVPLLAAALVRTDLFLLAPARAAAPALPPRFRDAVRLGRRTWLARDGDAGARVVVKEMPAGATAPLAAARLEGRGAPRLRDVLPAEGGQLVVFEHVPGRPLAELLDAGAMTEEDALRLARDLCAALVPLHDARLVHADVKPDNVVVQEDGRAVLVDLGACRRAGEAGVPVGTPRYMAPEVARGHPPDARADVYGVGLCVWEALERAPFLGRGGDAMDARLRAAYPRAYRPPAAAAPALDPWLRRALAVEADARFPDAAAASAALPQRS